MGDITCKCCRCRNQHKESDRVPKSSKRFGPGVDDMVCPRCGCTEYYKVEVKIDE